MPTAPEYFWPIYFVVSIVVYVGLIIHFVRYKRKIRKSKEDLFNSKMCENRTIHNQS